MRFEETRRIGRGLGRIARWLLVVGLAWGGAAAAAPNIRQETEVKAALLYNFARFVEWPPGTFASPEAPLVIGILGHDPFGPVLDELVEHESVSGHPIQIVRFRRAEEAGSSHVLFISSSERGACGSILSNLRGQPILTVAEFSPFLESGGAVQLHRGEDNKIRIRVNLAAARAASLTLSAKLLRVAEVVQP